MTTEPAEHVSRQALYRAAARATLAPSIHNTQPWRFVIAGDRLELYVDPARAVPVIDPDGRQRTLSVGAALFGVRLSLAAEGHTHTVELLPDPVGRPELMALVTITGREPADPFSRRLDSAVRSRHSNRREFGTEPVPSAVTDALMRAADAEGAALQFVRADDRVALAVLAQRAVQEQEADPAYRAELRSWTGNDPTRVDGVPALAVPHLAPRSQAREDVPMRRFDTTASGQLPALTRAGREPAMAVLTTPVDRPGDWLVAGQALYRVLIELTEAGFVASLFSQVCEVPGVRAALRRRLRLDQWPQIMVRAGTASPTAPTPRRPLSDVIEFAGGRETG
jgi:nitroreductase